MTGDLAPQARMADIEGAEVRAWVDMYAGMPADFRRQLAPEILQVEGVCLTRCRAIPFSHFNSVLDLGVRAPATERQVDAVLQSYREAGIPKFVVFLNPHSGPPQLPDWLASRGLQPKGAWERVCRLEGPAVAPPSGVDGTVEWVSPEMAGEWAAFLDTWYRLPTGPWLSALVGRAGWQHAVLRREGRIVAARSLFTAGNGWAWLGVEAPVPGLMAPSYAEDAALVEALVHRGQGEGAERFVADIEAPSASRDTPAYASWQALGFRCLYLRRHYVPSS